MPSKTCVPAQKEEKEYHCNVKKLINMTYIMRKDS
jgi:hypothetical protein